MGGGTTSERRLSGADEGEEGESGRPLGAGGSGTRPQAGGGEPSDERRESESADPQRVVEEEDERGSGDDRSDTPEEKHCGGAIGDNIMKLVNKIAQWAAPLRHFVERGGGVAAAAIRATSGAVATGRGLPRGCAAGACGVCLCPALGQPLRARRSSRELSGGSRAAPWIFLSGGVSLPAEALAQ